MKNILKIFKEKCELNNWIMIDGDNILPDPNSELLFNIAGITNPILKDYIDKKKHTNEVFFSIQNCIRTNDLNEIGDETHLTSFKMLGLFAFTDKLYELSIFIFNLLTEHINPNKLKIKININDVKMIEFWKKYSNNIELMTNEDDNLWFANPNEGTRGYGVELFYIRPNKEDLELANIVAVNKYKYLNGEIIDIPLNIDIGCGAERIQLAIEEANTVFDTSFFNINHYNKLDIIEKRILLDHLKTLELFCVNNIIPGNKKQPYIMRKMIRKLIFLFNLHKHNNELLYEIKQNISIKLFHHIQSEIIKVNRIYIYAHNYIKTHNIVNIDENFMKETFGCTEEILEELSKIIAI